MVDMRNNRATHVGHFPKEISVDRRLGAFERCRLCKYSCSNQGYVSRLSKGEAEAVQAITSPLCFAPLLCTQEARAAPGVSLPRQPNRTGGFRQSRGQSPASSRSWKCCMSCRRRTIKSLNSSENVSTRLPAGRCSGSVLRAMPIKPWYHYGSANAGVFE